MAKPCAICGKPAIHRHHLVKQQRIRRRWKTLGRPWRLTTCLRDPRLLVDVCQAHHEEEKPVPLPIGWAAAVAEYGLAPDLPRWLGAIWDAQEITA